MMALALLALSLTAAPCQARGELPDPRPSCTPGAVDAKATLEVVCGSRTKERRHVSEETKRAVLAEYGVAWEDRGGFEVDHLVPLACGGSNAMANLWPQPIEAAKRKDHAENVAHARVCSGAMTLAEAQKAFEKDWRTIQ